VPQQKLEKTRPKRRESQARKRTEVSDQKGKDWERPVRTGLSSLTTHICIVTDQAESEEESTREGGGGRLVDQGTRGETGENDGGAAGDRKKRGGAIIVESQGRVATRGAELARWVRRAKGEGKITPLHCKGSKGRTAHRAE